MLLLFRSAGGVAPAVELIANGTLQLDGAAALSLVSEVRLVADGELTLQGTASLTLETNMVAHGTMGLDGSAWLTPREHGEDTFTAHGTMRLRGSARLSVDTDPILPPTDEDGWTLPDVTAPDIQGMQISIGGLAIQRAMIVDLDIELDVEGGPKSATITLNCPLDRVPKLGRTRLLVTYKETTLFRGRLEQIVGDVSSTTGYTLTYAGPLVELRDHKAFRTVFVDSDLESLQLDQGAVSDQNSIFTVTSDEGGMSIGVVQYAAGD